jgi:hypothetical protein
MASGQLDIVTLSLLLAASGLFSTACDESEACQVETTLDGKSGTGRGPDEATAKSAALVDYCVRHDPTVDGKHRVWKAAGGKSSGDKAKDIENVAPLTKIRKVCEQRTASNPEARVEASCKD